MSGNNYSKSVGAGDEKVAYATALDQNRPVYPGTIAQPAQTSASCSTNYSQNTGPTYLDLNDAQRQNPQNNGGQHIGQNFNQNMSAGIIYDDRGQQVHTQQPGVSFNGMPPIVYGQVHYAPGQGQGFQPQQHGGPPIGRWRDGICDCCSNLYPSCACTFFCHGNWLLAQVAQKSNYSKFSSVMIPYAIALIVCFFISIAYGPIFMIFPGCFVILVNVYVRMHMVRKYEINGGGGMCAEVCTGLCCCCCSISQSKYMG